MLGKKIMQLIWHNDIVHLLFVILIFKNCGNVYQNLLTYITLNTDFFLKDLYIKTFTYLTFFYFNSSNQIYDSIIIIIVLIAQILAKGKVLSSFLKGEQDIILCFFIFSSSCSFMYSSYCTIQKCL